MKMFYITAPHGENGRAVLNRDGKPVSNPLQGDYMFSRFGAWLAAKRIAKRTGLAVTVQRLEAQG